MIPILLATTSALVWGTADYAGGRASRRIDALHVTVLAKIISLPVLVAYLLVMRTSPVLASFGWAIAAGSFGMVAMVLFYRALSGGAMAVVAPVSASTAAVLPIAVGLLTERSPGVLALVGVACAVTAIALISLAPGAAVDGAPRSGVGGPAGLGLLSGVGFGLFFILLNQAHDAAGGDAGLWPIAAAQAGALTVGAVLLARARGGQRPAVPRGRLLGWVAVAGVLDMTANVLYLVAVRDGLLSVVAPLASLYPVTTVLLALVLDRERIRPLQVAGLGLAVAALVLVAT